jgi:hypothetical protein
MNTAPAQKNRRLFARVIDAIAAFVAECNYASARMYSLQSPLLSEPGAGQAGK